MQLKLEDFAELFGTSAGDIPDECRELIERYDFRYRILSGEEREQEFLQVVNRIDSGEFSLAGRSGKARWDKGWSENLETFVAGGHDLSALAPKYFRAGQSLRLHQQYIIPEAPEFESKWYDVFRLWLFKTYLHDVDAIYEFGCGSGFNLGVLAALYPEKELHGLDWAEASKDIVDEMRTAHGWNTWGHVFDFFSPDRALKLADNSAVVTIGALEQTGGEYEAFLRYVLDSSPSLVLHVEPIVEWYDPHNLVDYAAIRFHKKRRYWEGYPDRLKELEKEGAIEILKMKRSFFGSLCIEGFSQLIWKPADR